MISQLLNELTRFSGAVKKNKAVNVNSKKIKQQAIDLGTLYFREYYSYAIGILRDTDDLKEYNEDWQLLISLAHGNNPKSTYTSLLKKIIKKTKQINITIHSMVTQPPAIKSSKITYSQAEQHLINTLDNFLPSAAASYKQGILDLAAEPPRLSYRGTATEFREAFRETLDHLALDEEVMHQTWFKPEKDQKLPTMKQKVRFILSSRNKNKTKRTAAEKTVDLIEALSGDIARAIYNRASLSTHIETTKQEVEQLKRYMDAVFFDLLEIAQSDT